ncbi:MAG: pirin family protein [Nitrospira sp.]|nr:pirin family protein [Nitrospira sp.]
MTIETTTYKTVVGLYRPGSTYMVGDGFPVRNLFPSNDLDRIVDPFLMLDYAGPQYFDPTEQPRGVGEHPHRGFETVTILYEGVVAHRDSAGHAGVIGPGDVQWMTAGSGVVHEEMHERSWAKQGGILHAIQLWVNVPRVHKMTAPNYQTILKDDIPTVELDRGSGHVRVIAGSYEGRRGPARTFTPIELYDVQLAAGSRWDLVLPDGHSAALFVLSGLVSVNGAEAAGEAELVVCGRDGARMLVESRDHSRLLVMSGKPIEEPIARYGPFVMNTKAELAQAVNDYQSGKMGHLL